jgi:hypothetical protein
VQVPQRAPEGEVAAAAYFSRRRAAGGFDRATSWRRNHAEALSQLQHLLLAAAAKTHQQDHASVCWPFALDQKQK